MNNLIIKGNTGTQELVDYLLIDELYLRVLNIELNDGNVELKGSLLTTVPVFKSWVDHLNNNYDEFTILSANGAYYVDFEDPVVRLIFATLGDGIGITFLQTATCTFGDLFKNNTYILEFNEFDKFSVLNNTATYDFSGCSNLESINLSNITAMKTYAFNGCSNLRSVNLLGSITTLPEGAFQNCSNLTSFVFPSTLKEIGLVAFAGCTNLLINVEDLSNILTFKGTVWSNQLWGSWWRSTPNGNSKASVVGTNFSSTACTRIEPYAFNGADFKTINLPNLTFLGYCAFTHNPSLEEVISLGNITTISNLNNSGGWKWGFLANCPKLKRVKLPETLTSIEAECFMGDSKLEEVNIPTACTSIGSNAFTGHDGYPSLSSLHTIVCRPTTPPTLNSTFPNNANLKIYVPDAEISTYQSASGWSDYSSKIVGLSTYTGTL